MIEVELRGFLDEEDFQAKLDNLKKTCDRFEEDHRETLFFMIPDSTLKVAKLLSKKKAKIALKLGDIVASAAQKEFELPIAYEDADTAGDLFKHLGFTKTQETTQTRYNLTFGDIDLSLKWSSDWGHHFEVEKLVAGEAGIAAAKEDLHTFCRTHGLMPLGMEEFRRLRDKIDERYLKR